jgi:hypothetical protein
MGVTAKVVRKQIHPLPKAIRGPKKVKVGFPAGASDGMNISKAVWNEFGTRGGASGGGWGGPIPERPFMRNAMRNNQGSYKSAMRTSAVKILRGETSLSTVLSKLGILAQGDIQAEITALMSPPNSPVTIALKGSSKPLIDSGEMRGAVIYKVDE